MNIRPKKNVSISGWGNHPIATSSFYRPEKISQLKTIPGPLIARGMGKSYGDAALNTDKSVVLTERLNRFLDFNNETGVLRAEAGVTIEEILNVFVPKGWFVPVTPGTKHLTLGGCVACDVHGKNHHRDGVFSNFVLSIALLVANGESKICSSTKEENLFWSTVGGMGLTGIIEEVTLQLIPIKTAYMSIKNHTTDGLEATLAFFGESSREDHYSVAWIDCCSSGQNFGRGVVMSGHHAERDEISEGVMDPLNIKKNSPHTIPAKIPALFLNSKTIRTFNSVYYYANSQKHAPYTQDYESYFYPLDCIKNWNQFYGKNGFVQYQFVIPEQNAEQLIIKIFEKFKQSGLAVYLAVLKRFGPSGKGYLSFPIPGMTLALDIPMQSEVPRALQAADDIVKQNGGRVYLAKDAYLAPQNFREMYPQFSKWKQEKLLVDPDWKFTSNLSRRLEMERS